MRRLPGCAVLALVISMLGPLLGRAGSVLDDSTHLESPPLLTIGFGPSQIWEPDRSLLPDLFGCQQRLACVSEVMVDAGASADAVAFFHLTGWFLTDIGGDAPVQLGTIFVPWRANENTQTAFLGGMPAVVFAEQEGRSLNLERDPTYRALLADHPDLMYWAPGPVVEGQAQSPDGSQRFLLKYRLLDGCHACAILGWVHAAFDFGPDGTYEGLHLLAVETIETDGRNELVDDADHLADSRMAPLGMVGVP